MQDTFSTRLIFVLISFLYFIGGPFYVVMVSENMLRDMLYLFLSVPLVFFPIYMCILFFGKGK